MSLCLHLLHRVIFKIVFFLLQVTIRIMILKVQNIYKRLN